MHAWACTAELSLPVVSSSHTSSDNADLSNFAIPGCLKYRLMLCLRIIQAQNDNGCIVYGMADWHTMSSTGLLQVQQRLSALEPAVMQETCSGQCVPQAQTSPSQCMAEAVPAEAAASSHTAGQAGWHPALACRGAGVGPAGGCQSGGRATREHPGMLRPQQPPCCRTD